ncbi:hypothetical protein [Methylobacterium cerastii]|uniref:hypothetical protein n=1 Tax=Methylobacterium cerastii TaxID=932741 RepID=UPI001EE2E519|nr:hypothetical protein [Methylobacterium cerastii]
MSENGLRKIFMLAACSGISPSEFRSVIDSIHSLEIDDLVSSYMQLRNRLRHLENSNLESSNPRVSSKSIEHLEARRTVISLAKDSELLPSRAARQIASQLLEMKPDVDNLEEILAYEKKESFARWIDKIIDSIGPSATINAAVKALDINDTKDKNRWRLSE